MLKSSLCDYNDACILVKGTAMVFGQGADTAAIAAERNKQVIFKNCTPFTNCISEINNTKLDNAKHLDVVMLMYSLIEYNKNYEKTSGRLQQYCKDDPNDSMTDSESFKLKLKLVPVIFIKFIFFSPNDSPSKTMKNAFYFI